MKGDTWLNKDEELGGNKQLKYNNNEKLKGNTWVYKNNEELRGNTWLHENEQLGGDTWLNKNKELGRGYVAKQIMRRGYQAK